MGNSLWRLQTTLNFAARVIRDLGREADVEILVTDWGSEVPLSDVLELSAEAAALTSFVIVPPRLARELQGESSFPEVLALNAAARRARGEFIGRIDQDTLVGKRFVSTFFSLYEGRIPLPHSLASSLVFANRREIPYRFTVRSPSLESVERFVRTFGSFMEVWTRPDRPFWTLWVGVWLAHRDRWFECGGYDERLIHYNWMETDMIARLMQRYAVVDLGKLVDFDFYHLEHYHPHVAWSARTHPKKNVPVSLDGAGRAFHPNAQDWGLSTLGLEVRRAAVRAVPSRGTGQYFVPLVMVAAAQMTYDAVVLGSRGVIGRLRRLATRRKAR
jgi:hypothetical protein